MKHVNLLFFDRRALLLQIVGGWFIVLTGTIVFVIVALVLEQIVGRSSAVIVYSFIAAFMYLLVAYALLLGFAMILNGRRAYIVAREAVDALIGRTGSQIRALKAELESSTGDADKTVAAKRKELSDLESAFEELFDVRQRIERLNADFNRQVQRHPLAVAARFQQPLRDIARYRDRIDHMQPQH